MTSKKQFESDRNERGVRGRPQDHRAEKHFTNAFRGKGFCPSALSLEEADTCGFDEDEPDYDPSEY